MQLLNIILFWLFFGMFAAHFAKKRGRSPIKWFFAGLVLGVIGVGLLLLLPKLEARPAQKSLSKRPPTFPKRSDAWLKVWYYLDRGHAQQGPFEFPDLIKRWKTNDVSENSFLWGEGMPEWKPLSEMPELIKELEQG